MLKFNIEAVIDEFQEKMPERELEAFMLYIDRLHRTAKTCERQSFYYFASMLILSREIFAEEIRKFVATLDAGKAAEFEVLEADLMRLLHGDEKDEQTARDDWSDVIYPGDEL